ncbi:PilZ domain-containing protein [Candidatus Omnitrophota bacterium]
MAFCYTGDGRYMAGAGFEEKRAFRRIPAKLSLRLREPLTKKWHLVNTCDISAQGIGLLAESELTPQAPFELWLPIPESGQAVYTRGKVSWSEPLGAGRCRAGIILDKPDLISRLLDS